MSIKVSYTQLMKDSEIILKDAGNGKNRVLIKFPVYFYEFDILEQTRIINILKKLSDSGDLKLIIDLRQNYTPKNLSN